MLFPRLGTTIGGAGAAAVPRLVLVMEETGIVTS